jgi:hypothetical protein
MLEAKPPPAVVALYYRLSGRPWPMGADTVMATSTVLAAATASLALVEPRLTKAGREAASIFWESRDALLADPADEKHVKEMIKATISVAREIEAHARRLM